MTDIIYSQEAEEAVLGACLISPDIVPTIDLRASDFYLHKHQVIWRVMQSRNGDGLDILTISEALDDRGKLKMVGGSAYLTQLINRTPSSLHADRYAEIIREKARRRGLKRLAEDIAKTAFDESQDIDEVSGEYISRLAAASSVASGAVHWSEGLEELWQELSERSKDPKDIWGIPTGLKRFDRVTGGLQLGELMILSGEPGIGKSILAAQLGVQMSSHAPGAIYSLEMGKKQISRRVVSARSLVPTRYMKRGSINEEDWERIIKAIEELSNLPVFLSDSTDWTTSSLRADLARLKANHDIQWFVVDYMYLMNDKGRDEIEQTAMVSKGLTQICKPSSLNLAGVAVHSMTKAGMDASVPGKQHLRGSGQISFDADLITFLTDFKPMNEDEKYLSSDEKDNLRTLWFGKGRELEDPKKYLHLVKRPRFPIFGDYAPGVPNNDKAYRDHTV